MTIYLITPIVHAAVSNYLIVRIVQIVQIVWMRILNRAAGETRFMYSASSAAEEPKWFE
jgi:hypothetical protein